MAPAPFCLAPMFALVSLMLIPGGCAPRPLGGATLQSASAHYEAGRFDAASSHAASLLTKGGGEADEAAWIIGLCDYRQGRITQARQRFRFVTTGVDRPLAAQARVMLAQIDLADGHEEMALANISRAWTDLPPRHQRRAAELAVAAAEAEGDTNARSLWLSRMPPAPSRTTPEIKAMRERFTLQVGAYRNRTGAESACGTLRPTLTDLGQPTIRTRTDRRGQTLYLVQVGSFTTRAAADAAKASRPGTDLMVVVR